MAITKRPSGYEVTIYIEGRRVAQKRGFRTKTEAKQWQEEQKSRYRHDPNLIPSRKVHTFEDLVAKYEELHLPTVRNETRRRYEVDLKYRIKPYFRFMKLDAVNEDFVITFRAKLMKDLENKSINNCINLVRSIFNLGVRWGMMRENPCRNIDSLKVSLKTLNWWEEWNDIERFLKATRHDRYGAAYRLAIECGLRLGEIVGLSKQDVDLERCQIRVHRQWNEKDMSYGPPKHNRPRWVGFDRHSDLRAMLAEAIANSPDPEIIFVTRTGRRQRNRKLAGQCFQRWVEKLELPRITFHDLRHTFASWFMIRNDNIWTLMELLGHSSVKTTMRYAHLSSQVKRAPALIPPESQKDFTAFSRHLGHLRLVK